MPTGLTDKEAAFLARMRAEVGKVVPSRSKPGKPGAPVPTPVLTPLDQQTVMGWDHPEAADTPARIRVAAEEKWAQMAELLEAERSQEAEKRARMHKTGRYILLAISVALLFLTLAAFRH